MSDEQINKRIAAACGWKPKRQTKLTRTGHLKVSYENTPDYCNDLNAIHDAEKVLTFDGWDIYCVHLGDTQPSCAKATARQRAEAFLRTLGKWEEVQG